MSRCRIIFFIAYRNAYSVYVQVHFCNAREILEHYKGNCLGAMQGASNGPVASTLWGGRQNQACTTLKDVIAERARKHQLRKPESVLQQVGKQTEPIHTDKELGKIAGVSPPGIHDLGFYKNITPNSAQSFTKTLPK